MTESKYTAIWAQTEKAAKYLYKHGRATIATSDPSGYGVTHLITYRAADVSHAEQTHIGKAYPSARIVYTTTYDVASERLTRDICAARQFK
jgi:hypothetical protein